ncbi:MAG: hypothetical protein MHMPM18_000232 [Marteilia pararefringens]
MNRERFIRPTGEKDTPEVVKASLHTLRALIELLDDRDLEQMKVKTFMELFKSSFEAHELKSIIGSVKHWMNEIVYTFDTMEKRLSPNNYLIERTEESQHIVEILYHRMRNSKSLIEEVICFYENLAEGISSQSDMS